MLLQTLLSTSEDDQAIADFGMAAEFLARPERWLSDGCV